MEKRKVYLIQESNYIKIARYDNIIDLEKKPFPTIFKTYNLPDKEVQTKISKFIELNNFDVVLSV